MYVPKAPTAEQSEDTATGKAASSSVSDIPKTAAAAKGALISEGILTLVPLPTKCANSLP
jgi:hypothetical protein